jgi:2-oxoglutarate ferredoxin oxidoreductase subunit beta
MARGAVSNAGSIARTKKYLRSAFELQTQGAGFTFVEVLTMRPTGWFVPPAAAPPTWSTPSRRPSPGELRRS